MNRNQILHDAVDTFGRDSQMMMMVEEMSELTKAISKFTRYGYDNAGILLYSIDVIEEIADVQIVLDQMKIIFDRQSIEHVEQEKLKRLENRIAEYKEKEVRVVNSAQTVHEKPVVHGKWVKKKYKSVDSVLWWCSACNMMAADKFEIHSWKYCPLCGAEMEV